MRDQLIKSVYETYQRFISGILDSVHIMTTDYNTSLPHVSSTMQSIEDAVLGLGLSIVAILFMVEIITTMSGKLDGARWEDVVKIIFKAVIARSILFWAPTFLGAIYYKIGTVISVIGDFDTASTSAILDAIHDSIDASFPSGSGIIASIKQLATWATYLPNFVLMFISYIITIAISYGRTIEILILTSLAPIPLSFIPFSQTSDVPKRYLLNYSAVVLQGLALIVCFKIYLGLLAGGSSGDVMYMTTMTVVLLLCIGKSSTWAKTLVGMV